MGKVAGMGMHHPRSFVPDQGRTQLDTGLEDRPVGVGIRLGTVGNLAVHGCQGCKEVGPHTTVAVLHSLGLLGMVAPLPSFCFIFSAQVKLQ